MVTKFIGNTLFEYEGVKNATIEECVAFCKAQKKLGLDIETTRKFPLKQYPNTNYQGGLDPYLSKIVMLQIGTDQEVYVIDTRCIDVRPLKEVLENNDILKIGHNLKFEGLHLMYNYQIALKNVWDTMICERVLYNGLNLSYSLAALAFRYLGIEISQDSSLFDVEEEEETEEFLNDLSSLDYKEPKQLIDKSTRLEFLTIGEHPFTLKQVLYGKDDIVFPFKIQEEQAKGRYVSEEDLYLPMKGFKMENAITQILAKMQLRGMLVDGEGWMKLYERNMLIYRKQIDFMNKWVIKFHPKFTNYDLFNIDGVCNIQWSSSKQVIALAKDMGFCPREMSKQTKRMEYTVGAVALFKLLTNPNKNVFFSHKNTSDEPESIPFTGKDDVQSFILNYLLLKKYEQLTTTFGKEWLEKYVHPITGRIHPSFRQLMNTGRLSCTSPKNWALS